MITENSIWIEPLPRCQLSYYATFTLSQLRPLNTGLTVLVTDRVCKSWHRPPTTTPSETDISHWWLSLHVVFNVQWWSLRDTRGTHFRSRSKGDLSIWFVSHNHRATILKMCYPIMESLSPISMPLGSIDTEKYQETGS